MLMKSRRQASKKGFTLTEAALVLGIVGLILGAIWVAAGSVYRNMRVATTTDQMLQIVQAIRSLHATQPHIDPNLTEINLAKAGGVPKDMLDDVNDPTAISNAWGGNVTIKPVNTTQFYLLLEGIPTDACADLLTRNTGSGRDTGLAGVAGGTNGSTITTFPVTVTTAVGACTGTDGRTNAKFIYNLRS